MANKKVLKNNELQVKFRKGESITNLITEQNTIFFLFCMDRRCFKYEQL